MAVMAKFERLASGYYLEGLTVASDTVWFSDVIGGGIHCRTPDGNLRSFEEGRKWIGGLLVAEDGAILSTGRAGIRRTDPVTGKSEWALQEIDGQPVNGINELAPDGQGGLYFGEVDLDAIALGKRPGRVAIFRLHADGHVSRECGDLGFTNAMAVSPDGRKFYCNESFDGTYVHDIGADGSLSGRRLFLKKPDCDGMALDTEGNVWITGFSSSHIERVAPDGTLLPRFETPAEAITQLRFGGSDGRDIYFVCVPIEAGAGLAKGELPEQRNSHLMRARSDIAGHVPPPVRLRAA